VLVEKGHGQRILESYHTVKRIRAVTTEDFIISLFCLVADQMGKLPKRADAKLYPSELVTIGLLYALKGGFFRAFYCWLKRDFEYLFVELPDRTRIPRALRAHQAWSNRLLADPTFVTVIDPLSLRELEVLALIAQGCTNQQIADQLYISVSTVKKHINHIYGKLDVTHRAQAVACARSLKILA
jgi:DNA-binding CsgD family transcriptional regulator